MQGLFTWPSGDRNQEDSQNQTTVSHPLCFRKNLKKSIYALYQGLVNIFLHFCNSLKVAKLSILIFLALCRVCFPYLPVYLSFPCVLSLYFLITWLCQSYDRRPEKSGTEVFQYLGKCVIADCVRGTREKWEWRCISIVMQMNSVSNATHPSPLTPFPRP